MEHIGLNLGYLLVQILNIALLMLLCSSPLVLIWLGARWYQQHIRARLDAIEQRQEAILALLRGEQPAEPEAASADED